MAARTRSAKAAEVVLPAGSTAMSRTTGVLAWAIRCTRLVDGRITRGGDEEDLQGRASVGSSGGGAVDGVRRIVGCRVDAGPQVSQAQGTDRLTDPRIGDEVRRRLTAADVGEGGAGGRPHVDDGWGRRLRHESVADPGMAGEVRMADGDDLAHDRTGFHLVRARHLQRAAEGLVGGVREGSLVFRLEDVALEADDGLVRAAGVVSDRDHVAEGHVLRDEVREARLQRPEERLHGRRLAGQTRWMQDADADARCHEGGTAETVENEPYGAIRGPGDRPLPDHVDVAGLAHAIRPEADLEGLRPDVALVGREDGLDRGPVGVSHGAVDAAHRLDAGRGDPPHRAVDDGEAGGSCRDPDRTSSDRAFGTVDTCGLSSGLPVDHSSDDISRDQPLR